MIYYLVIPGTLFEGSAVADSSLFSTLEAAEAYAATWEGAFGYNYVDIVHITPDVVSDQKIINTIQL